MRCSLYFSDELLISLPKVSIISLPKVSIISLPKVSIISLPKVSIISLPKVSIGTTMVQKLRLTAETLIPFFF